MKDLELLTSLYCIHSKSGNEKRMRKFIKRWISRNIDNATIQVDEIGNILVTKGVSDSYPCICSHIDQVQINHSRDFKAIICDDIIIGYSDKCKDFQGLGADDKNGIWVALMCLKKFDVLKCAFFVGEEIGCVGSSSCDISFFSDCRYCIQCDRRNGSDLITEITEDLCSDKFLNDIDYVDFGYKPTHGLSTDIDELRFRGVSCSCINVSCGYYNPHTDNEFTVVSELFNCLDFVEHIVEKCVETYPHESHRIYSYYDDLHLEYNDVYYDAENCIVSAIEQGEIYDYSSFVMFVETHRHKWETLDDSCFDMIYADYEYLIDEYYKEWFEQAI